MNQNTSFAQAIIRIIFIQINIYRRNEWSFAQIVPVGNLFYTVYIQQSVSGEISILVNKKLINFNNFDSVSSEELIKFISEV